MASTQPSQTQTQTPPHEQHLRLALDKKDLGNAAFRNAEINQAIRYYHESVLYLLTMVQPKTSASGSGAPNMADMAAASAQSAIPKPVLAEAKANLIAVYSNLAACHTKNARWDRVLDCCTKALSLDQDHVKSLYRKGLALARMNRTDQAVKQLRRALELAPNDANIIKELHACKQKEREQVEKQKRDMAGMFERGSLF
ncbi:hypothetical protein BCR44DRAFT_131308 [Catenaria anguillulae PL171]|uniref:Uncharacterized protein n=1 Tax=Catenaria anguillulae PL171 TaxID=765915 RepID=A0A1Y2H732_9FUNG|nr:hypothetical protein BCR44DRAFT_131308 [Catenaria anguillulae PL171]